MRIHETQEWVHETAIEHGWWETEADRNIPTKLCLIHSEISEALEEFRKGTPWLYYEPGNEKPEGIGVELADAIIRILDLCGAYDFNMEAAVVMKASYNESRAHRHGGKAV